MLLPSCMLCLRVGSVFLHTSLQRRMKAVSLCSHTTGVPLKRCFSWKLLNKMALGTGQSVHPTSSLLIFLFPFSVFSSFLSPSLPPSPLSLNFLIREDIAAHVVTKTARGVCVCVCESPIVHVCL